MSDKIIYPSIDLFIYDFKDCLGQTTNEIDDNYKNFCEKIYGDLDKKSFAEECDRLKKIGKDGNNIQEIPIELLTTRTRMMSSPLDGYYYPLQMDDTLALHIDYSGKLNVDNLPNDNPIRMADNPFSKLKDEVSNATFNKVGTLGQTWLLWGQVTEGNQHDEVDTVAKSCYVQVVNDYNWERDFIGRGKWLEGDIFELWRTPSNIKISGQKSSNKLGDQVNHLLIWLFPSTLTTDEIRQRVRSSYYDLIRLFQYRHKIVWSYYQSRHQKNLLKREYSDVQPSIREVGNLSKQMQAGKLKLNHLQETLTNNLINLSEYTSALNSLMNQAHTLQVNLYNYKTRLDSMKQKYSTSDLGVFEKFSDSEFYAKKYQKQLEMECSNFSPGLTLLESLNSTIQGIVELERTKSERSLDTTIAIAGIGLAMSGLTATTISVQSPQPRSIQDISFLSSPVLLWSLIVASPFLLALLFRIFKR
jgi:hypothetical protein